MDSVPSSFSLYSRLQALSQAVSQATGATVMLSFGLLPPTPNT